MNGFDSEKSDIKSGVPQGSVLGPLLFLIYINDLESDIKSNINIFADNTMLYSIVNDPHTSAHDLNHDLSLISHWAHQWKMEFNPDPSKQAIEIIFSCKKTTTMHPPLLFNERIVSKSTEHKHLGLTLQSNLCFDKHLNDKIIKAKKNINVLKNISPYLPIKALDQFYKAHIRSHLDYCDFIYHIPSSHHILGLTLNSAMVNIEKVQYKAALAITGTWQGTNRVKLYDELGWESLSDRRSFRRLLQLHKIIDGKTPPFLRNELPLPRRPFLPYVFRNIRIRSYRYANSFFPDAINFWNIIITHFKQFPSYVIFRNHLLSLFRPKSKPIYGIHDPIGLHFLFQLRLGLSPLKYHKNRHNFADTPTANCVCNDGIEDVNHFLFHCSLFLDNRVAFLDVIENVMDVYNLELNQHLEVVCLYGHVLFSESDNKKILLSTIKFLKDSKRFSS